MVGAASNPTYIFLISFRPREIARMLLAATK